MTAKQLHTDVSWTHPSVLKFAPAADPVDTMIACARSVVLRARDEGWSGPPFDPVTLAEMLRVPVVPREDIPDARTVPLKADRVQIEFNPNRPRGRVRYSIAHELAHTFFPDRAERVRNRLSSAEMAGDDWQLEMLCNIGAAEILMPVGSLPMLQYDTLGIDQIMALRRQYDVSAEAILLRVVRLTDEPCLMFAASRSEDGPRLGRYHVDYSTVSRTWAGRIRPGSELPADTVVSECTAIGFTAKGEETWQSGSLVRVECVGIPPYPRHSYPRVAGVLLPTRKGTRTANRITILVGDATEPRSSGHRIIAQIVNDKTPRWGAGFALCVRKKWPEAQDDFVNWVEGDRTRLKLGNTHFSRLAENLTLCHMISQHGYGPSTKPRIRYWALENCLQALASTALEHDATVHMPRIGSGQAGGSWELVSELIDDALCRRGVKVTVYDLPGTEIPKERERLLFQ